MAAERLQRGELAILPSDAGYLLAWTLDARGAEERASRLRRLDKRHLFTLLCRSIGEVSRLARLDDAAFRVVKRLSPGPRTFILPAGAELPRRLKQAKRRTVGCRIIDHPVMQALLETLGGPLVSTTLQVPDFDDVASHDAEAVAERLLRFVDCMLDAGDCPPGPTTIIELVEGEARVVREGWQELPAD